MYRFSLFCLLLLFPLTALSQNQQSQFSFYYSTNIPDQPIGFDGRYVELNGLGWFAQVKSSPLPPSDDTFEDLSSITARDVFGDKQVDSKTTYVSLNGGLTFGITRRFHIWSGVGLTASTLYQEFSDPTHILAEDGTYWVSPHEEESQPSLNVLGGVGFYVTSNWSILVGAESSPEGVNMSIGYVF